MTNLKEGKGSFIDKEGACYVGKYINGQKQGEFNQYYPDGSERTGMAVENKIEGTVHFINEYGQ